MQVDPCAPSPCGPYAQCRNIRDSPSCSCSQGYIGSPPNCRPECIINSECPSNRACIREKCQDPCLGSCGVGAQCNVINHIPICTCSQGYTGDPFSNCIPKPPECKNEFNSIANIHVNLKTLIKLSDCNIYYTFKCSMEEYLNNFI